MNKIIGKHYEIQQQLSKKNGRITLLARDLNTDESVIIKLLVLNRDWKWNAQMRALKKEAKILQSLSHPAIPPYLNYFAVDSSTSKGFALVQTYIPDQSLERHLQNERIFTEDEIKIIAKSLLQILVYLHRLHPPVFHWNIKPSNILLGERSGNFVGSVHLVDFGFWQTAIAPGEKKSISDICSLGATLIYLLIGTHPDHLSQNDLQINKEFSHLSPSLRKWLIQMIEPDIDKGFSSAVIALKALEQLDVQTSSTEHINRPIESKIQLHKQKDSLGIIIPSAGLRQSGRGAIGYLSSGSSIGYFSVVAIFWNYFILIISVTAFSIPFPMNILFLLPTIPFWCAGFWMVYFILISLYGHSTYLKIDSVQIYRYQKLFGKRVFFSIKNSPRNSITQLVYTPKHIAKNDDGDEFEVPPTLSILAGLKKFQINGFFSPQPKQEQLEWLAQELSDWLDIPITRKIID